MLKNEPKITSHLTSSDETAPAIDQHNPCAGRSSEVKWEVILGSFLKKIFIFFILSFPAQAANILIVGDSLSAGYGINIQEGWVALLQKQLPVHKIYNASISGDTTGNGLARLPAALKKYQPDITIIELGANDGLRGIPLSVIRNNLSKMVDLAQQQKSKVLLLGIRLPPNYGPEYTQKFQQLFLDLAKQKKVSVVPLFLNGVDENPDLLQNDGLHPKANAQQKMLDTVWPYIQSLYSTAHPAKR